MTGTSCALAGLLLPLLWWGQAPPAFEAQALVDDAIRDHRPVVTLPAGPLHLPRGLTLDRAEGLTIEGAGTTLIIGDIHSPAVKLSRCKDVVLRGFTVDYDPLPFTQGTVTSRSADGTLVGFEVHAGYPDLTADYLPQHAHIFAGEARLWKRLAPDIYPRSVAALDPRHGTLTLPAGRPYYDQVQPGDRLVLNYRGTTGVLVWQSENVRVEGVTLLTAPGCGVMCRYMRGDNRFQYDIRPGPPPPGAVQPRLMSTCADGFNYAFARRGPILEHSHFSYMGDDSVNLHGPVLLVTQVVSPTELLVASPYGPEPVDWLVEAGDVARRLQPGNYAVLGEAAIAAFARTGQAEGAPRDLVHAFWPRVQSQSGPTLYRVTLREPLAAQVGEVLDLPAINAPHFRLSGCTFSDHRARGVLVCSPHGVVENCTFARLKRVGLKLDPGYVHWREAGWVEDVTVRGNVFEDVGICPDTWARGQYELGAIMVGGRREPGAAALPYPEANRRLVIESNTVRGCSVAGIHVRCARDVTIRGNHLSHTNYVSAPDAGAEHGLSVASAIDVRGVPEVTLEANDITALGQPIP